MKPLRPYIYYAYYSWICDNNSTPYLLVNCDYPNVDVPIEFIRDGKIILNISPRSIGNYVVDNEGISFSARFQGMIRDLYVPFGAAEALYAQETGDGTMFQEEEYYSEESYLARTAKKSEEIKPKKVVKKKPSHLKLVK